MPSNAQLTVGSILVVGGISFALWLGLSPSTPGTARQVFEFTSGGSTTAGTTTGFRLEVRQPTVEWWTGWPFDNCAPGDASRSPLPVIKCELQAPTNWGCYEARLYRVDYTQPVAPATELTTNVSPPSNVITYGVCPNPMPARVPLAAPEPRWFSTIVCGLIAIVGLWHLRKTSA